MFFNFWLHLHSFPLRADWWKSDSSVDGEPQGNWKWNLNSRDVVASSPSISLQLVENLAAPLMASTPGIEPGLWSRWKASVLTTTPPLLLIHLRVFWFLHFSVILRPWVLVRSWGWDPRPSALQSSALPTESLLPRLKNRNVCYFSLWSVKRTRFLQLCALRCVCWQDGR